MRLDNASAATACWRAQAAHGWIVSTKDIVVLSLRGMDMYVGYVPEPTVDHSAACFLYSVQTSETFLKLNHNFSSKALHILSYSKAPSPPTQLTGA